MQEIGKRIISIISDLNETNYLFQRISIAIQRGNAASFLNIFHTSKTAISTIKTISNFTIFKPTGFVLEGENKIIIVIMTPDKASLLGAPLTDGPALNDALYARCGELSRAIGRLSLLPAHDALTLLKSLFNAPKIMHTLHCSPCFSNDALEQFDSLLRSGLCTITNLAMSDPQWIPSGFVDWYLWHYPPFSHPPHPPTVFSRSCCSTVTVGSQ